ncbi:MAG: NAD/NADP octopine/nopaline dehydrogenase family protein [Prevotella sp.]|nr:NAD/NADP octopine/nopaline dehydrogenase family protein [Bacteroidales bacterium]MBR6939146.1 NAD/NADP octopine/nopaline dehydrogenase family protein [Prevotella sp.]
MKIAVIGAGNGGQAISTYASMQGHEVRLYDIEVDKVKRLLELEYFSLKGCIQGIARIKTITADIAEAVRGAELVMVTTIANAHVSVAKLIAPFVEEGQVIVLNPGRTCGALVFRQALVDSGCTKRYYLAEAQTLVYACRIEEDGIVNIIGVKDEVLLSAIPASDTAHVLSKVNQLYPCLKPAPDVLHTSLENIGAIFHPCVLLFNAGTIERKTEFYFYRDMTERIAAFIEELDGERLAVGHAYGIELLSVCDWIKFAYKDTEGNTLCERMRNNPSYHDIKSPTSVFVRQLTEDIPTGIIPMMELGKNAMLEMKLFESITTVASSLLGVDLYAEGRTLKRLGLEGMTKEEIIRYIVQ